jgi:glycosyltransferase involved in cell wall biosynthesis
MKVPLVSAIIPTHNRAALLQRAIRSVQEQTYSNLEIIVVDDASQDKTQDVVKSINDHRVRYLRHDVNKGGAVARNTGIRAATGGFIAFLDDDDEWKREKTEDQLRVLATYDVVMCRSDGDASPKYSSKETVELEDLQREGPFGGTGVLMAKADVLKQTMFDESLPRCQDWDLIIRIALKHKIAYLNKRLLRYDTGAHLRITNSVPNIPIAELEQYLRMYHKHKEFFGTTWFTRHMCNALLYGIRYRRDKIALLMYTARQYGLINVVRTLANRVRVKWRESSLGTTSANRTSVRKG